MAPINLLDSSSLNIEKIAQGGNGIRSGEENVYGRSTPNFSLISKEAGRA